MVPTLQTLRTALTVATRIEELKAQLQETLFPGTGVKRGRPAGKLGLAGRRRIADAQRARWAKFRRAKNKMSKRLLAR